MDETHKVYNSNGEVEYYRKDVWGSVETIAEQIREVGGYHITDSQRWWLYKIQTSGEREVIAAKMQNNSVANGSIVVKLYCKRMSAYYETPAIISVILNAEGDIDHWGVVVNERLQVNFCRMMPDWDAKAGDWKRYCYLSAYDGSPSGDELERCLEGKPFPPLVFRKRYNFGMGYKYTEDELKQEEHTIAAKRNHGLATFIANRVKEAGFLYPLDTPLKFNYDWYYKECEVARNAIQQQPTD